MLRAVKASIAGALLALLPSIARADDGNFRPYLVGGRASGMGGAFTALADDPSGPFYNPAGIAHATHSQISLSGSLFGVLSGSIANLISAGQDFKYRNLQTFPIQTSGIYKLGSQAPELSEQALAVSIFVPNSSSRDTRADIASETDALFYSVRDDTVWAGLTYARRLGKIAIGGSLYGLLGTQLQELDLSVVNAFDPSLFVNIKARSEELQLGVVGALGVRWDVSPSVKLGLSVFSPELAVYDRRSFFVRALASLPGEAPIGVAGSADDLTSTPALPLRAQTGFAFTGERLALTFDLMWLAPRSVRDNTAREAEGFDRWVKRHSVINGSAGIEFYVTPEVPLRAGVWTDFSAAVDPTEEGPDNTSQLDRYGFSLGTGLRSEHTESSVNLNVAKATGHELIPVDLDFSQLTVAEEEQLGIYLVFATSFQF